MAIFNHRETLHHGFGNRIVKWNPGSYFQPLAQAIAFNMPDIILIYIILVDTHQRRDIEMATNIDHPVQVMYTRKRRLSDHKSQVSPGQRRDDRTAYSRRSIADNVIKVIFLSKLFGLLPDQSHQFPRVLLGNSQPGMNQRSIFGIRYKPASRQPFLHCYSVNRTYTIAEAAAFARSGINLEISNGSKAAQFLA